MALALAGYSDAFFRMSCPGRIVRDRIDPIVNPGKIAGHAHTISGGSGFKADMSYADARASKCSSCPIKVSPIYTFDTHYNGTLTDAQEDLSNYWTPQLYVRMNDGTFKPVPAMGDPNDTQGGMTVYYLQRPSPSTEKLKAYPEGFRMLAGDNSKRTVGTNDLATRGVSYACLGANKAETNNMPDYKCPGGLRAQIFFPSCWDGKNLDSDNHKSHMSYPDSQNYDNGPCPASHPVHMMSLFYEVLYDTKLFDDQWNGTQHPFVFANGDTTGYGFHGDFVNGWDVNVLQKAIDTCTDLSGDVNACKAVTTFSYSENQQCQIPTTVNEQTGGTLQKLPGCNPLTPGGSCSDNTQFGAPPANFVDLTQSKKWEYSGCGGDDYYDRAFRSGFKGDDSMTVQMCVDYCSSLNMPYAGLEYSRECFCSDKLNSKYAPKDGVLGNCNYKCAGDSTQTCGGSGAMSIYHDCKGDTECRNWDINGNSGVQAVSSSKPVPSSTKTSSTKRTSSTAKQSSSSVKRPSTTIKTLTKTSSAARATATKVARRHARQI